VPDDAGSARSADGEGTARAAPDEPRPLTTEEAVEALNRDIAARRRIDSIANQLEDMGVPRALAEDVARLEAQGGGTPREMLVRAAYDLDIPPYQVRRALDMSAYEFRDYLTGQMTKAYGMDPKSAITAADAYLARSFDADQVSSLMARWGESPEQAIQSAGRLQEAGLSTQEALVEHAYSRSIDPNRLMAEGGLTPREVEAHLSSYVERYPNMSPDDISDAVRFYMDGSQYRLSEFQSRSQLSASDLTSDISQLSRDTGLSTVEIEGQISTMTRNRTTDVPEASGPVQSYVRQALGEADPPPPIETGLSATAGEGTSALNPLERPLVDTTINAPRRSIWPKPRKTVADPEISLHDTAVLLDAPQPEMFSLQGLADGGTPTTSGP
jgi:hypothetical protein